MPLYQQPLYYSAIVLTNAARWTACWFLMVCAREVPDLFAPVRPLLLRQDGSPRLIVRVSWPVFLCGAILWPPIVLSMGFRAEGGRWPTQMSMIRFAFMGIYMYSVLEFSENTQRQKAAIVSKQSH
jgi:hypothetical protein